MYRCLFSGEEPSLQQDFNKLASINKIPSPLTLSQKSSLDSENTSQVLHTDLSNIDNSSRMIPSDESMDRDEKAEDATDSPVFGLMKSQSVSAKASLWQQMQMQANKGIILIIKLRFNEFCVKLTVKFSLNHSSCCQTCHKAFQSKGEGRLTICFR